MARVVLSRGSPSPPLVTALGALISLLAPAIVLTGTAPSRGAAAVVSFVMVAVPVAVGVYAQQSEGTRRFGRQLVLIGCGLGVTTLAYTGSDVLYSIARITGWCMEVALIYVLLAYPTGHLPGRAERLVVAGGALLVALLYLPTVPFAEFPLPAPWTTCVEGCPTNAFAVASEPAFVADIIEPVRGLLAFAIYIAAAAVLARRVHRASPLARTSLTAVLGVAVVRFASEGAFVVLRGTDLSDNALVAIALAVDLTIPLAALGFLVGILRWRLRIARVLERLTGELGQARDADGLQAALRSCLDDSALRLYLPDPGAPGRWRDPPGAGTPGRWRDPPGAEPEAWPDSASGRALCEIEHDGAPVALIHCDVAISEQRSLIDAIGSAVASFLERARLTAELRSTLTEIDASRTRIAAAADATRRQIERDLHDGTQQRLIALRIRLELIEAEMSGNPDRAREMLRAIGPEVEAVIGEIRDLSRGIYPPLLTEAGPAAALGGITARLPVPARVSGEFARREEEVEAAVYFCCVEAIQNAIKHGRDLGEITISFDDGGGDASFEVIDDGGGFGSGATSGSGITNMHDRLAAVGGTLTVTCSQVGTRVRGVIPARPPRHEHEESTAPAPA